MSSPEKTPPTSPAGGHHADVGSAPPVTPTTTRKMLIAGGVVVAVVAILLISSFLPRHATSKELSAEVVAEDAAPVVQVITARRASEGGVVELPGLIQALHESAILRARCGICEELARGYRECRAQR